jgi:hypothetical protein
VLLVALCFLLKKGEAQKVEELTVQFEERGFHVLKVFDVGLIWKIGKRPL